MRRVVRPVDRNPTWLYVEYPLVRDGLKNGRRPRDGEISG